MQWGKRKIDSDPWPEGLQLVLFHIGQEASVLSKKDSGPTLHEVLHSQGTQVLSVANGRAAEPSPVLYRDHYLSACIW